MRKGELDTIAARELALCLENDGRFYPCIKAVCRNLARHQRRGDFSREKAIKAFYPIATAGAKDYCKTFGGYWNEVFTVATRWAVAESLFETFEGLGIIEEQLQELIAG